MHDIVFVEVLEREDYLGDVEVCILADDAIRPRNNTVQQ